MGSDYHKYICTMHIFAHYCWCNEPCLPSAVEVPSFPCQSCVFHMLPGRMASWGFWPAGVSLGTLIFLFWPGQSSCRWPSLCRQTKATKQHPASTLWVTNCTGYSSAVGSDLIYQLHRSHLELEQLEDGMWSPAEGQGHAPFTQNPPLPGFCYAFLLRKPVWYLLLAPTGWSSSLLIACWPPFPLQKGWDPKHHKGEQRRGRDKATANAERLLAREGQSCSLPGKKKASKHLCIKTNGEKQSLWIAIA